MCIIHDGCATFDKHPTAEDMQVLQELGESDEEEEEEEDYDEEDEEEADEVKEELEDLKDDDDEEVYGGDRVVQDEDVDSVQVGVKRQRAE